MTADKVALCLLGVAWLLLLSLGVLIAGFLGFCLVLVAGGLGCNTLVLIEMRGSCCGGAA